MKNRKWEKLQKFTSVLAVVLISSAILGGCGRPDGENGAGGNLDDTRQSQTDLDSMDTASDSTDTESSSASDSTESSSALEITFGDSGEPFTMYLYDNNDTAAAIAEYVGTSGWRLPVYEYDDDVNYDVMQYYDIPNRYEIPSEPQQITSAKAGEVYYSDPGRVILFYEDVEISGEYTPVGYFDPTEEFVAAVRENPTLEGWGNKIVQIERP